MKLSRLLATTALLVGSTLMTPLHATIVQFNTSLGNFEVNLFDETTPKTVENFLSYVKDQSYDNNVVHRLVPGFIVQGGGFVYTGQVPFGNVVAKAAVQNEPKWSNRRGTIAMAKIGDQPNSATSQWFFNLVDNQTNLDAQNGGFTVFGQISVQGLEILQQMAQLPTYNFGGAATNIPLRNYTSADFAAGKALTADNLVLIESVFVIDTRVNTAAGLTPVANTLASNGASEGDSGSGSINWLVLLLLPLAALRLRAAHRS